MSDSSSQNSASMGGERFTPPTVEELNERLPQFEFVEMLGLGGMGAVYKARQPKLDRFVAIKVLPPIPDDELGFAERFEREAQSMAKLSHPHIVGVHDFGETDDGQLYFVMEYIEGADLHKLIMGGQLTLDHFFGWIPQICEAMEYAHKNGIVHRDIKPANILINSEGVVKMADFGLAKLTGPGEAKTALTMADLSMGTPDYAAPEQIEATEKVDFRADIYSLGVVMYQLLTGHLPRGAFKTPSEENTSLDPRLDGVVLKAMQSSPDERFQKASDISTHLSEIRTTPRKIAARGKKGAVGPRAGHNTRPIPENPNAAAANGFPKGKLIAAMAVAIMLVVTLFVGGIMLANKKKSDEANNGGATAAVKKEKGKQQTEISKTVEKPEPKRIDKRVEIDKPNAADPSLPQNQQVDRSGKGFGGGKKGGFGNFRNKLGMKSKDVAPEKGSVKMEKNLFVINRSRRTFPDGHPLVQFPENLKPVQQMEIGQGPTVIKSSAPPFVAALQINGEVAVWGTIRHRIDSIPPEAKTNVKKIAAGPGHILALTGDGDVIAWGDNRSGQSDVPGDIAKNAVQIAAGKTFSAALLSDGSLRIWGEFSAKPDLDSLPKFQMIDAGFDHLLALDETGKLHAWGDEQFGLSNIPPLLSEKNLKKIATTMAFSAALTVDGEVVGWGPKDPTGKSRVMKGIVDIQASGDVIAVKHEDGDRWEVLGSNTKGLVLPPGLRGGDKQEIKFAMTSDVAFIYRVAKVEEAEQTFTAADMEAIEASQESESESEELELDPESEAGKRIADLQEKFEKAGLEQLTEPFGKRQDDLDTYFRSAIEREQLAAAQAADLETAKALKAEIERIAEEVSMPEVDEPDTPEKLVAMRTTYRTEAEKIHSEHEAKMAELIGKYDAALIAIRDDLTRLNLLDDAEKVQKFIDARKE